MSTLTLFDKNISVFVGNKLTDLFEQNYTACHFLRLRIKMTSDVSQKSNFAFENRSKEVNNTLRRNCEWNFEWLD